MYGSVKLACLVLSFKRFEKKKRNKDEKNIDATQRNTEYLYSAYGSIRVSNRIGNAIKIRWAISSSSSSIKSN